MVPSQRNLIVQIIVSFIGLSVVWAESELDTKAARLFKVRWSSISYNKTMYNPAVSSQDREASEKLSLSCEIEILDPNLVLGTCHEPIIKQLTDRKGQNIDPGRAQPRAARLLYEVPNYRTRFKQPPGPSRWETLVRSVLRLPQKPRGRPELVSELEPSRMQIELDAELCERAGGQIGRVKGHFYALMAESLEHVEVPFEPNDNWVRLTPDLEIQVREARYTGSSFHFKIETHPQGGASMQPLTVEGYLPSRIVVARQLIGADGKPTRHFAGLRRLPASVGGSGSGSGGDCRIEKIRYVIAVNPTHHKIPFELERIPLPHPVKK